MRPAYKSHPLFKYRRILLINALISVVLGAISLGPYGSPNEGIWGFHLILIVVSALFSMYDLLKWAAEKTIDPDQDPKWPSKCFVIGDALLACVLLFEYFAELLNTNPSQAYSSEHIIAQAYASLTTLLASSLHGHCFWQQIMTIKKREWMTTLPVSALRSGSCRVCARIISKIDSGKGQTPTRDTVPDLKSTGRSFFTDTFASSSPSCEPGHEVAAGSSTKSACLITPVSDEDLSDSMKLGESGIYGTMESVILKGEPRVEYNDEDVILVKKKKSKWSRNKDFKGKSKSAASEEIGISFV